ncbi:hypothetical protein NPN17_23695, partial [Vibrio parahaemolyticus]|nr:hypothetical protein [Vibrio parahaemolyticus]
LSVLEPLELSSLTESHFSVSVVWVQVSSTTDRASVRSYPRRDARAAPVGARAFLQRERQGALCDPSTVKYHVINMLQKTGLENKLQPAIAAS